MKLSTNKLFQASILFLFVINILQAIFTELIFDEAYYWHYAQNLSWGYFDHPPMVALLIKLSSFLFPAELGVRFMSTILSTLTLVFLWKLISEKNKNIELFLIIGFSATLMNAYGFLTLPDTPLLFFTTAFLWAYKQYLISNKWLHMLLMGALMAALMYSKYHAVLVIGFVVVSNLKLLKDLKFWTAVGLALLLYVPHLLWLYNNEFVTIKYHLFERPNSHYKFDYTSGFFLNMIALFGFLSPFVYWALFKTKSKDLFIRSLLFLTYGILIFFFISSFNRRIQTQWIIAISIPLILLTYSFFNQTKQSKKWLYRIGIFNVFLIFYLRLALIYEPVSPIIYETHGNKEWVNDLKEKSGDIPVVFRNAWRDASMYGFYSGNPYYSMNTISYRKNQYSIDDSEASVQNKKVALTQKDTVNYDFNYHRDFRHKTIYASIIENFKSNRKIMCVINKDYVELKKDTLLKFSLINPYKEDISLQELNYYLACHNSEKHFKDSILIKTLSNHNRKKLKQGDTIELSFITPKDIPEGTSYIRISISDHNLPPGLNGNLIPLK